MMNQCKKYVLRVCHSIMRQSMLQSTKQRGGIDLFNKLRAIRPNISNQYTSFLVPIADRYLTTKLRCQHVFQVRLAQKTIAMIRAENGSANLVKIADIGDSSGTHTQYLRALDWRPDLLEIKSVNLDPVAIEKIRSKGLDALLCRAENLQSDCDFSADIFFAFEVIEHLIDPIRFMREIALRTGCRYFGVTVPLVHKSRMGLQFIRHDLKTNAVAEDTHVFELSPEDWKLLFKFSGWKVTHEDLYYQYPKYHPLSFSRPLWRRLDVDGFYGVVLERDLSCSDQYKSW